MLVNSSNKAMRIDVLPNGPYKISGGVPLSIVNIVRNADGEAVGWEDMGTLPQKDVYFLCRCGESKSLPYCDGAHVAAGFDGTEIADKEPFEQGAEYIKGEGITLADKVELCMGAGFCHRLGGVWNLTQITKENSGLSDTIEAAELVQKTQAAATEQACLCPSGRLVMYRSSEDEECAVEPEFEPPSIALIQDTVAGLSSALWLRGNIPVFDAEGKPYELRNRVTLCRCGRSGNKPYCDGQHIPMGFNDGLA